MQRNQGSLWWTWGVMLAVVLWPVPSVAAEDVPPPAAQTASADDAAKMVWGGTVEAVWGYSLARPSNGVINGRYYDIRHNLPGLQAALLTNTWEAGAASGTLQLQFGVLSEMFWASERKLEQDLLWRLLQEATTKWTTPVRGLSLEGGVYNTPFGPEYNVVYLNWNTSTSNLFALMPYQIGGFRLNYQFAEGWNVRAGVYNGWDRIVTDNNDDKSVMLMLDWEDPRDEENYFYLSYMAGNERNTGDQRGAFLRHTIDVYGQWHAHPRLYLRGHILAGMEATRSGGSDGWFGAAVFGRYDPTPWLFVAARADGVRGFAAADGDNWLYASYLNRRDQATTVLSGTLTVAVQTAKHATLRLEGRHDWADFDYFFGGTVLRNAAGAAMVNRTQQTTLSLALATWF